MEPAAAFPAAHRRHPSAARAPLPHRRRFLARPRLAVDLGDLAARDTLATRICAARQRVVIVLLADLLQIIKAVIDGNSPRQRISARPTRRGARRARVQTACRRRNSS